MSRCVILLQNAETSLSYSTTDKEIVAATRVNRMADGFCCWLCHMHGKLDLPEPREAEHLVVTFWPNNPYNPRRAEQRGLSVEQYIEWAFNQIQKYREQLGDRFLWCIGWETFQPVHWCRQDETALSLKHRSEGFAFFKQWVTTSLHTRHWRNCRKFGEDRFNQRPGVIEFLIQRDIPLESMNLTLGNTSPALAHYSFEAVPELKAFWWECGNTLAGLQVGFPYVRGAARQYGKQWLADVSPYSYPYPLHPAEYYQDLGEWGEFEPGAFGHCRLNFPKYTPEMVRLAGFTPEAMLRCWVTAIMSGADYLFQEASCVTHFVKINSQLALTPYGNNAQRLAVFNRRLPEKREPLTPVALLLDFHHGLEPYTMEKPWGWAPSERGDAQILSFFQTAYPGHSAQVRSWPWTNQQEYGDMLRAGFDFRPYERKTLCDGRWPDMFNVYLSNAAPATFQDSRLVLCLGRQTIAPDQQNMFLHLTAEGRDLILTAGQVELGAGLADGLEAVGDETNAFRSLCVKTGEQTNEIVFPVWPVKAAGWNIRATTEQGFPLLLERRHGKGRIFFLTCPFALGGNLLLQTYIRLLDELFDPLLPFKFVGRPIQRIVNRAECGYLVALINNGEEQWRGKVTATDLQPESVDDIWNERPVVKRQTPYGCEMTVAVPAFEWVVLEIRCFSRAENYRHTFG